MGFSIGNKGYVGTGERYSQVLSCTTDFWEWDQTNDIWKKVADFGGQIRMGAIGFSIGQKGYLGLGINLGTIYNDFWEYTPSSESTGMNEIKNNIDLNIFPNPSSNKVTINFSSSVKDKLQLKITNSLGEIIYSESKKDFSGEYVNTFDLSQQPKGVYFLEAIIGEERRTRKIILQ
jgi:N-acetylneuraminic acid mutarotase